MSTTTATPAAVDGRPGPVTFVGVVLCVKAVLAIVVGIAFLVERDDLVDLTGRTSDYMTTTAITEFIVAFLLVVGAWAIFSGQNWARIVVAVVVAFRLGVVAYWMIAHLGGGIQWNALINAGFGIFVLWALYGNADSERYFRGQY